MLPIGCLNSLWGIKIYLLTQKSGYEKLWLNQWLAMDEKYVFLRQRNKENY